MSSSLFQNSALLTLPSLVALHCQSLSVSKSGQHMRCCALTASTERVHAIAYPLENFVFCVHDWQHCAMNCGLGLLTSAVDSTGRFQQLTPGAQRQPGFRIAQTLRQHNLTECLVQ